MRRRTDGQPRALPLLAEVATALFTCDSPDQIARAAFSRVAAHLDLDLFLTHLADDEGAELSLQAFGGLDQEEAESLARFGRAEAIWEKAAAERRPIVVERVEANASTTAIGALGLRACACHPLLAEQQRPVGTVLFGSRRRDTFTEEEIDLIQAIASQVAAAIERSRALEERRRATEALRTSEEKFARAFHGNAAGMTITRVRDGVVLDMNETYTRMSGYDRGDLVGESISKIWKHPADRETLIARLREQGAVDNFEVRALRKDGVEWTALLSAQVITLADEPVIIASLLDITDRKRTEAALRESEARLAEADRRKDEFIAVLSHELRNPLAPIRYALPILERSDLGEGADRAVAVIERQVTHLTRLVDDLLDVSRITRGKIELRREHVALSSIVSAAVEAASPAIVASRHCFDIAVADEPMWLYADPARVAQVLTNLLNNSAKYTPRGGRIALEAAREDRPPASDRDDPVDPCHGAAGVARRPAAGSAVIRVSDNGIGIPPDSLRTVFEMYRQVDRPERSQGGLGIGLALARQLVEMHGGTIAARSAGPGRGSEFVVRLPLAGDIDTPSSTVARIA